MNFVFFITIFVCSIIKNQHLRELNFYNSNSKTYILTDFTDEFDSKTIFIYEFLNNSFFMFSLQIIGFKKLIRNRGYDAEISLLIDPTASDPLKGPACMEKCPICMTTNQTNQTAVIKTENISDKCVNNNEQILRNSDSDLTDNQVTSNIHIDIHVQCMKNTAEDNENGHFVKTINGKFFMVNGANISCACPRSPNGFSKYCHLCDGFIDLILVRHTSFFNNLRFLMAMSSRNCRIVSLN